MNQIKFLFFVLLGLPVISFSLPVQFEDGDSDPSMDGSAGILESQNADFYSLPGDSEAEIVGRFNKKNRFLSDLKQDFSLEELKQLELELLKGQIISGNKNDLRAGQKSDNSGSGTGLYFLIEPLAEDPEMKEKAKKILELTKEVREVFSSQPTDVNIPSQGNNQYTRENNFPVEDMLTQSRIKYSQNSDYDEVASDELYEKIKWAIIYLIIGIIVLKLLIKLVSVSGSGKKKYRRRMVK